MTLRLKNGRFATAAKARKERNPFFHRALISAVAAFRRAGFDGRVYDSSVNERRIVLDEPVYDWEELVDLANQVEVTKTYPELIYNVSLKDTRGKWWAATHAWESVELTMTELKKRIKELMNRYEKAAGDDEGDYAIIEIEVSVYKWRR